MTSPLSLQTIQSGELHLGNVVNKIDNQRLYETNVYTTMDEKRRTLTFWTPEVECMRKDDNHLTLFLPQTDECEGFYNTLRDLEDKVKMGASEHWKTWFPKDDLSLEDIQERFVSCIKAGSKEEQGRVMNLKTSSKLKCKVKNTEEVITDDYQELFDKKTKRGCGRILIELRRVIFGRGNFKMEFVAHQVLLNEPEVDEPETERFNNESWVDFE